MPLNTPSPSHSPSGPRPKLLVVAGAGAAIEFGMPSVWEADSLLWQAAQPYFSLTNNHSENLYGFLRQKIDSYWATAVPPHLNKKPNFEDVLYSIYALGSVYPAGIFTGTLGAFVTPQAFPDVVHIRDSKPVDSDVLRHLGQHLSDALLDEFRRRCSSPAPDIAPRIGHLHHLFAALNQEFDIAVVTTNYDDLIYRSLPPIETGFDLADNGRFKAGRIINRNAWPCLLHLHGSVHFDMDLIDGDLHGIAWRDDLSGGFHQNSFGRSSHSTTEGNDFPTSAIIAGYGKSDQIQRLPFRTYYSELDRLVHESEAVLLMGFSMGDAHVRQSFSNYRDGRDRKIVVIDYARDGTMLAGYDFDYGDSGAARALRVFDVPHNSTEWLGHRHPASVDAVKSALEFERSRVVGKRLSIWYNGMLAACQNPSKIVNELLT